MKKHFIEIAKYDYWCNMQLAKILYSYKTLTQSNEYFHHILEANYVWYSRLNSLPINSQIWIETPDIDNFEERTERNYSKMIQYIESIDTAEYDNNISYTNTKGEKFINNVGDTLTHIFNHSTHHRAQILIELKEHDIPRPAMDYIFWKRG